MKSSAEFKALYAAKTPASRALSERALRTLPAGVVANVKYFPPYPLFMQRAGGSHLWDVDGNEYVDYCLAFGPLILGHGHPAVARAVQESFEKYGTTISAPRTNSRSPMPRSFCPCCPLAARSA